MTFRLPYFFITILLFITEYFIGTYMHDEIIRPYGGDFLVVIFLYCFIKTFFKTPVWQTAIAVLLLAYLIETLQYIHLLNYLGWADSKIAVIILGNFFAWGDIVAYTLGIALVLLAEQWRINRSIKKAYTN